MCCVSTLRGVSLSSGSLGGGVEPDTDPSVDDEERRDCIGASWSFMLQLVDFLATN
jgi:hypothetical protein